MAKAAQKAKAQHPNPLDPRQWGDVVFTKIHDHQCAVRAFEYALEIPEIPQCLKLRERQGAVMSGRLHRAERALAGTVPETVSGAIAALGYYLSSESGMSASLDDLDIKLLGSVHRRLVAALGFGPVVVPIKARACPRRVRGSADNDQVRS